MPGMVGGLGGKVAGGAAHVVDKAVGNTVGTALRKAQNAMLGGLPEEAVLGSFQTEEGKEAAMEASLANSAVGAPRKKQGLLRRLAFWRRRASTVDEESAAKEAEAAEMDAAAAADAALAQTLEGVLEDGGMALPTPAEALDACLNDEACDVEEEAKLRAQELSMQ